LTFSLDVVTNQMQIPLAFTSSPTSDGSRSLSPALSAISTTSAVSNDSGYVTESASKKPAPNGRRSLTSLFKRQLVSPKPSTDGNQNGGLQVSLSIPGTAVASLTESVS